MAVPLDTLLARVLLFLHMVRGAFGVSELGALLCKTTYLRLLAGEISRKTCNLIWKALRKKVAEVTRLAHAEGLNAGLTGSHPLLALVNSQAGSTCPILLNSFCVERGDREVFDQRICDFSSRCKGLVACCEN